MIEVMTVGQRKPMTKMTFGNKWYVLMQMTSPVSDNGTVQSFGTDIAIFTPHQVQHNSFKCLSPDQLAATLNKVMSY